MAGRLSNSLSRFAAASDTHWGVMIAFAPDQTPQRSSIKQYRTSGHPDRGPVFKYECSCRRPKPTTLQKRRQLCRELERLLKQALARVYIASTAVRLPCYRRCNAAAISGWQHAKAHMRCNSLASTLVL